MDSFENFQKIKEALLETIRENDLKFRKQVTNLINMYEDSQQTLRDNVRQLETEINRYVSEQIEKTKQSQKEKPKPKIRQFTTAKFGTLGDAVRSLSAEGVPLEFINKHLDWIANTSANDNGQKEYILVNKDCNTKYILKNTRTQVFFSHECYVDVTVIENCD
jgi:hypothetical protein